MKWLEEALCRPPELVTVVNNKRESGVTPVYKVMENWAVNIYSMRGEIFFPDTGESLRFSKGDISFLPARLARQFFFHSRGTHKVILFSFSAGIEIPDKTKPMIFKGGELYRKIIYLFDDLLSYFNMHKKNRAHCLLWELLWQVYDSINNSLNKSPCHPALAKALAFITANLEHDMRASEIAQVAGVSHNQLNRIFHANLGCSITKYIWQQRMRQVEYLLCNTDLPIKKVALEVGISDLQYFNKTCWRYLGCSPSAYRQS